MRETTAVKSVQISETEVINSMVDEAVNALIAEAVKHFNTKKKTVRNEEDDARYFYRKEELDKFMEKIKFPESVHVQIIKDHGEFFAYRVGRVMFLKKGIKQI